MSIAPNPRQQFTGHLGVTLILTVLFITLIPIIVMLNLALLQVRQDTIARTMIQQNSQVEIKVGDIRRWLESSRTLVTLMLAERDVRERIINILDSDRPLTTAVTLQAEFLTRQLDSQSAFTEYFLFNRAGIVRVSTQPTNIGTPILADLYHQSADRRSTSAFISTPLIDASYNTPQLFLVVPFFNAQNESIGGFVGRLDMYVLFDIMSNRVSGEIGETFLLDMGGRLITPLRRSESAPGSAINNRGIDSAIAGEEYNGWAVNASNQRVIGTYKPLPDLHMIVVAEVIASEALNTLNTTTSLMILMALSVAALTVAAGIAITIWIVRPIAALIRVANAVTQHDYSQRVPITRNNELGQLALAINVMTDELVNNIQQLDERIEQLNSANERAQEAVRLKDEFLAVMSHELRTPLNASIGHLGLLQMSGRLSDEDAHRVDRARKNNERLLSLINNILDHSRLERGRMNISIEPLEVIPLLLRIKDEMQILAEQKNLYLELTINHNVPPLIYSDADALHKILGNLIANAIKFTERGGIDVRVWCAEQQLCIEVKDSGIGIPDHMLGVIFESFRQVDASSRRVHGGSGLGLSIAKRLSRTLNGDITVKSVLGEGSTFLVRLPLQQPYKDEDKV